MLLLHTTYCNRKKAFILHYFQCSVPYYHVTLMLRVWHLSVSVCLSVSLLVTLMDFDHTVQQKVEINTRQDRLVTWCLGYLQMEADPDHSILWSWIPLKKTSGVFLKCWVLHFGSKHVMLSQHVLSLIIQYKQTVISNPPDQRDWGQCHRCTQMRDSQTQRRAE